MKTANRTERRPGVQTRLRLVKGEQLAPRRPLGDTSGDDRPLSLPTMLPRGVYTARFQMTLGKAVVYAISSSGIMEAWLEVATVGEARAAKEELERLLARVDGIIGPTSVGAGLP